MVAGKHADIPGSSSARFPGQAPHASGPPMPGIPRTGQIRDLAGRYSGGMAVAWIGLEVVAKLPERVQGDLRAARDAALERLRQDMVDFAQTNAPWEDVTGDARAELNSPSITEAPNGDKSIILAHGVEYGIYLETMDGGALGIIPKTIEEFSGRLSDYIRDELPK